MIAIQEAEKNLQPGEYSKLFAGESEADSGDSI